MSNDKDATALLDGFPAGLVRTLQRADPQQRAQPKAALHTRSNSWSVGLSDLDTVSKDITDTVIVVEGINLTWMKACSSDLNIEPHFFVEHAGGIVQDGDPWIAIMGETPPKSIQESREDLYSSVKRSEQACYWHLDGISTSLVSSKKRVTGVPRHSFWTKQYGWKVATRLSFWRCDHICLILVDSSALESPFTVHLPVSRNRGGLIMPGLYNEQPSLYDSIRFMLSHSWHFDVLFSSQNVSPITFSYILTVSIWRTNLERLDSVAKRVGFEEIRNPTAAINNKLHDLRRDLDNIRKGVARTSNWMPSKAEEELYHIRLEKVAHIASLHAIFEHLTKESSTLEKFLMDSFSLLLSSISVQEAELSAKTGQRAQQLTALAFIYIPLSFVTGIFGMNISEINGSLISAWVPVATLAVTLCLTALTFGIFNVWQRKKKKRNGSS